MALKKLKPKDINLLAVYKKKKEPSKYTSIMKYAIPPIVLALVIFGLFAYLSYQNHTLQQDIDDTNIKIVELQEKIAKDPNLSKSNTLAGIISATEKYRTLYDDIQSYPQLTQATFDQLIIAAGVPVTIQSFAYTRDAQAIQIVVEAKSANESEEFVRRLKASETFASVSYSGYTAMEQQEPTTKTDEETTKAPIKPKASVYTTTIQCVLK